MIVEGLLVSRRSLGRKLAFADVSIVSDDGDRCLKVIFSWKAFLGRQPSPAPHRKLEALDELDEDFPTKTSCLPFGARVKLELGSEHKGNREVLRWKIVEHPKVTAEKSASLGTGDAISCSEYLRARKLSHLVAEQCKPNKITRGPKDTKENLAKAGTQSLTSGTVSDLTHGGKKTKAKRAKIFASWVLERFFGVHSDNGTFEKTCCQPCAAIDDQFQCYHVLDVAGGKGTLSLELMVQQMEAFNAVRGPISSCTVIDPLVRGGDSSHMSKRIIRARSKLERGKNQSQPCSPTKHHASNGSDREGIEEDMGNLIHFEAINFDQDNFVHLWSKCNRHDVSEPSPGDRRQTKPLLLGMHPDEPTETIVDTALKHSLPFAVVPCCVFADLYPNRKLRNEEGGETPVRTYEQFIEYLLAKDASIRIETLPFQGKCTVIYRTG